MATYNFYQDQKITVWERHYFSVEASSYEDAVEKVHLIKDKPIIDSEGNSIVFKECKTLYDTTEQLSPEENRGCSTLEIFNENGVEIGSNAE